MQFNDLAAQYADNRAAIDAAIAGVLAHGRFIMGPEVADLERELAAFVGGDRQCIACGNGTDALQIALRALGIGPGDEVITTCFTWISSAEVIGLVGATPVFADIEADGFNLAPEAVAAAITPRTRAIIAVGLFGQMPPLEDLAAIAAPHGIAVIEDAAQSLGATRHGVASGAASRIATTSFFPAKPLGCFGDGGAVFTDDPDLAERCAAIRTHGGRRRHEHALLGTNSRLDTLQAAVLLAKLPVFLGREIAARGAAAERYHTLLGDCCRVPTTAAGNTHVYAQYTVRVPHRDAVRQALADRGIPSAVYYPRCLHTQPVFAGDRHPAGAFPVAEAASREVLSLPMSAYLAAEDQERVADALRAALSEVGP